MEIVDSTLSGALWPISYEDDNFDSSVFISQGLGTPITLNVNDQRRKLASELLEVLESTQTELDEPYSGWLEEPMDLEVFGQSLEQSSGIPLDEVHALHQSSAPSSPLVTQPLTPLAPTSPQELYSAQDDNKFEEGVLVVPDNGDLLESLESLLHQLESNTSSSTSSSASSPEQIEENDVDAVLLDSLISENVEQSQLLDELAEISMALMQTSEPTQQTPEPQSFMSPTVVPSLCFDSDSNSATSVGSFVESIPPRRRGRKPQTPAETLRKPRKRAAKPEDKRLRKKEQNKTAATRYRMKKKAELEVLLEEEEKLEQRNRELQSTYDDLASEVRYLKKLFREILGRS